MIQRLFGVSMALDGEGELPAPDRHRCAEETQAALTDLRTALQRPLGRAPRATRTTLTAEVRRLASVHPDLGLVLEQGEAGDVPSVLEPLAQSVLTEAVRNAHKHASPTRVSVRVGRADGAFWLEIVNDGVAALAAARGWACGWPRSRPCSSTAWSSSASASPASGRCGWSSRMAATMSDELPIDELEISTDEDGERSPERLRVLVVDDHDVVHWGFRLMLTQQPWVERCVSALSGAEALELVVRYRPHVALVDLFIGEESGAEVCERLRAAEPATRVLLFSGAGEISPRAARAAGASGFAYKDWPARRIASAVRMVGLGKTVFERHDRAGGARSVRRASGRYWS